MVQDLFIKQTAKDRLYDFIKATGHRKTSEIIRFASDNFSNRGDRDARLLASEGKIRRMCKSHKDMLYPGTKELIWEIIRWTEMPVTPLARTRRG